MLTRPTVLHAVLGVIAVGLTACNGGSASSRALTSDARGSGSTPSSSSSGSSQVPGSPAVVEGVTLTTPGARLRLGEAARVTWHPNPSTTGVVAVRVTGLLRVPVRAFHDWRLDRATRRSTPYFVHATVRNLGRRDLSHVPLPLYLLDRRNTLLKASRFLARFPTCPSRPLPAHFGRGDTASVCLVYFVPRHGKLAGISFRPTEGFDPITWQGKVVAGGVRQR